MHVEPSLHPWDETILVIVYDLFDVMVYNSLFLVASSLGFGMSIMLDL
jgi:hypothetical protein